ncbi:hypothetical protein [Nonomuraea recticatena]|uniref:DUF2007 domain-containing protein n=1 Tax=Nonomuraea recticatena TaxID=46178 RepID=A0ABP6FW32_9ACTN
MSGDEPEFGHGEGNRPLWTVRDRDAETIRTVLRKAGLREFSERHGGFLVEGGYDGGPFLVAFADDSEPAVRELAQCEAALLRAGYRVALEPSDAHALRAWP